MDELANMFVRFSQPHWRRLHVVARRYTGSEESARDLVQEVLFRAWRNFSPSAGETYRPAWLFVIMRNVVSEWNRATKSRITLVPAQDGELTEAVAPDTAEPFAAFPSMDEGRFRDLLDERIAQAFDSLEAPFREVLVLSIAGGLTYREVGEVLDCPVGTVMSRIARARRTLRERLANYASMSRRTSETSA